MLLLVWLDQPSGYMRTLLYGLWCICEFTRSREIPACHLMEILHVDR